MAKSENYFPEDEQEVNARVERCRLTKIIDAADAQKKAVELTIEVSDKLKMDDKVA